MKKIIIIVLVISLLLTTGCTKKSESLHKEVTPLKGFQNTEYNAGMDYQYFWDENADTVAVGDGYYINYQGYLHYISKDTLEEIPACSNVNCSHNTEECDAYLGDASFIQYYDGYLYYVNSDSAMKKLYRRTIDGSLSEKICDMFTSDIVPRIYVHRGYAYYSLYTGGKSTALFRVALKTGAEPEKLYVYHGYDASINKIEGYGDGILFVEGCALDKKYEKFEYNICYYDSNEDAIKSVVKDARGDYAVVDGKIYYTMPAGIRCYDVSEGTDELFYEMNRYAFVSYDGKYLYLDNMYGLDSHLYFDDNGEANIDLDDFSQSGHEIYVVDLNGKLIDTVELSAFMVILGDEDCLFQNSLDGIYILDKSMIGTGKHEWVEIPLSVYPHM